MKMTNRKRVLLRIQTISSGIGYPYLESAFMTFQRLMNDTLRGLVGHDCFVYLDDIVIYGKDFADHNDKNANFINKV